MCLERAVVALVLGLYHYKVAARDLFVSLGDSKQAVSLSENYR